MMRDGYLELSCGHHVKAKPTKRWRVCSACNGAKQGLAPGSREQVREVIAELRNDERHVIDWKAWRGPKPTVAKDRYLNAVANGVSQDLIDRLRFQYEAAEYGIEAARRMAYERTPGQPDDSGYKPRSVDPPLKGQGRATGQAAAAVKRGRTVTAWQHAELDSA